MILRRLLHVATPYMCTHVVSCHFFFGFYIIIIMIISIIIMYYYHQYNNNDNIIMVIHVFTDRFYNYQPIFFLTICYCCAQRLGCRLGTGQYPSRDKVRFTKPNITPRVNRLV